MQIRGFSCSNSSLVLNYWISGCNFRHCGRRVNESNGHMVWYHGTTKHLLCEDLPTKSKLKLTGFFSWTFFFVTFFFLLIYPKRSENQIKPKTKHRRKNMEAKKLLIMFWAVALTTFSEGGQLAKSNLLVPTQPPSFESKVSLKSNRFLKKCQTNYDINVLDISSVDLVMTKFEVWLLDICFDFFTFTIYSKLKTEKKILFSKPVRTFYWSVEKEI